MAITSWSYFYFTFFQGHCMIVWVQTLTTFRNLPRLLTKILVQSDSWFLISKNLNSTWVCLFNGFSNLIVSRFLNVSATEVNYSSRDPLLLFLHFYSPSTRSLRCPPSWKRWPNYHKSHYKDALHVLISSSIQKCKVCTK